MLISAGKSRPRAEGVQQPRNAGGREATRLPCWDQGPRDGGWGRRRPGQGSVGLEGCSKDGEGTTSSNLESLGLAAGRSSTERVPAPPSHLLLLLRELKPGLRPQSPTFVPSGASFMEDSFSMDWRVGWGTGMASG